MGAGQIADLVRVADVDVEARLCCLLHAHTRLRLSLGPRVAWRLYRRGDPRASRRIVFIVVEIDRIHHAPERRRRGRRGRARTARCCRLLLRGRRRSLLSWRGCGCSQGPQRVVYSLQACWLRSKLAPSGSSSGRGSRRGRDIWGGAGGCFGGGEGFCSVLDWLSTTASRPYRIPGCCLELCWARVATGSIARAHLQGVRGIGSCSSDMSLRTSPRRAPFIAEIHSVVVSCMDEVA